MALCLYRVSLAAFFRYLLDGLHTGLLIKPDTESRPIDIFNAQRLNKSEKYFIMKYIHFQHAVVCHVVHLKRNFEFIADIK
jgi:hypothetical protein